MNKERLAELKELYKDRDLFEELVWGIYWDHSGYTHKQDGEFLNWLCLMAYERLKALENERPTVEWIYDYDDFYHCSICKRVICTEWQSNPSKYYPYCHCGAKMKQEA